MKKENEISTIKYFNSREALFEYYKNNRNKFDLFSIGKRKGCWLFWKKWKQSKNFPLEKFKIYFNRRIKMIRYGIEYKERRRPQWERYGTTISFNTKEELVQHYKEEFENIVKFRLYTNEHFMNSWGVWHDAKDFPVDVFEKYVLGGK